MKSKILLFLTALAFGAFTSLSSAGDVSSMGSDAVLEAYAEVAGALVDDDLPAARQSATALADAAKASNNDALAQTATKLVGSDSLSAAREAFKAASAEVIELSEGKDGYYVMTCPMAQADWVQTSKEVANPYMGKRMPQCGMMKSGGMDMGSGKGD